MIRPFTCVCLLLAAGSGLYLYQTKHQTQMVDRDIERTLKLADATWQRSGVLRAEYTLLNDPSRLADLAGQYLPTLQTTTPGQFSTLADLDHRLPPVGPPPTDPAAPDVAAATPDIAAVVPAPLPDVTAPVAPHAEPSHSEPARIETAHLEPARPDPPHIDPPKPVAPAAPPRPPAPIAETAPRPVQIAPPRLTPPVARSVLPSAPIAPPITSPPATGMVARAAPAQSAAPTEQIARAAPPAPYVGSALGMARTMTQPPMQPLTPGAPNAISLR
jgi:hypothetical protein